MRLLSERDVRAIADPDQMIADSEAAFRMLSNGLARIPPRTELPLPGGGNFFVMPGLLNDTVLGVKLIAARPEPDSVGAHATSLVLLVDAVSLTPLGLISADWLTDLRTAAGLAAATRHLARPDARTLALYGTGKLAEPTIRLLCRVRAFTRIMIVGRSPGRAAELVARLQQDPLLPGVAFETEQLPDAAAAAADVITTVTTATTPVFDGRSVRPGTHVNLAGAFRPDHRESDDALAATAAFYFDSESACLERAGDIVLPLASGALTRARIRGEIGALFAGRIPGRAGSGEITVFKSLGNAVQDLYLGKSLLGGAEEIGLSFDPDPS